MDTGPQSFTGRPAWPAEGTLLSNVYTLLTLIWDTISDLSGKVPIHSDGCTISLTLVTPLLTARSLTAEILLQEDKNLNSSHLY